LSITLPNNDRFSKFFHCYTQQEICNKDIITDSATLSQKLSSYLKIKTGVLLFGTLFTVKYIDT